MDTGEDETLEMNARDRDYVLDVAYKTGYREGATAGKDLTFQESFDSGFAAGFRAGFHLAKYQGLSTLLQSSEINIPFDFNPNLILNKPSRGCCNICGAVNLDKSVSDVIKEQELKTSNNLEQVFSSYSVVSNEFNISLGKNITDNIF